MIVPPIVVAEGADVSVFASVEDVVRQLEPWFADEPHRAYDAEGRALDLVADPPIVERRLLFGLLRSDSAHESELRVVARESEPGHAAELAALLRERLGESAPLPLPELLDRLIRRDGYA